MTEVPGEMVVRTGRRGPRWSGAGRGALAKGKMKVWDAVLVPEANDDGQEQLGPEAEQDAPNPKRREIESTAWCWCCSFASSMRSVFQLRLNARSHITHHTEVQL